MTGRPTRAGRDPTGRPADDEDALGRAVAAYARALRLSCRAARKPTRAALTNDAVAAHIAARAWAEEAVRRAGRL
ncbi:hypothetical protein tb265_07050 [Gemmatimonadetes bacterium T265]|nr:hypothetical protein tb265_07050 [Gemmatimonadetes bacterium T265]